MKGVMSVPAVAVPFAAAAAVVLRPVTDQAPATPFDWTIAGVLAAAVVGLYKMSRSDRTSANSELIDALNAAANARVEAATAGERARHLQAHIDHLQDRLTAEGQRVGDQLRPPVLADRDTVQ